MEGDEGWKGVEGGWRVKEEWRWMESERGVEGGWRVKGGVEGEWREVNGETEHNTVTATCHVQWRL